MLINLELFTTRDSRVIWNHVSVVQAMYVGISERIDSP